MTIKSEILKCRETIAEAQARIEKLQQECPHSSYHVGEYMWRIGSIHWRRICDECDCVLPEDPNNDEIAREEAKKRERYLQFLSENGYAFNK